MPDPDTDRDPIEALASEFLERQRSGESPSVEEYAEEHPELADEIRELFPTIAATERLKARKAHSSGERASLGGVTLERLGDFRIVREIGRGGMGIVYEAEQESLGRRVAIKVLPRQALLDARHLKRFRREARIAAGLHHTNIVEVFGVGEQDGFHYYVMQYIEGRGLDGIVAQLARHERGESKPTPADGIPRQLLGARGPRHWRHVARIGLQVAQALRYAHSQGTLHRDVKPGNLLVDDDGTVWVTDFGLAKAVHSENVTQTGDVAGTLRYMAPEQFDGQSDARSDIYSLGLTLYELVALRPAFDDSDRTGLIRRIAHESPAPLRRLSPTVPRDLETIILKAMAREPGHRYASAEALAADLQRFLDDRPIHARRAGSVERLWRWCRRNRAVSALAATTLLSLVLVAVAATAGYLRTKSALEGEARERRKAEDNARIAAEALDRIFARFSPRPTASAPELSLDDSDGTTIQTAVPATLSREAAAMLEDMLPFFDRLAAQGGDGDTLRRRAGEANRRVGDIRYRLGQYEEAIAAYRRAIAIYTALGEQSPGDLDIQVETASIYNELGRVHHLSRLADEARDAHDAALAILQPLASAPEPAPEVRYELARTFYLLGMREKPPPVAGPRGPERGPPRGRPWRPRDGKGRRRREGLPPNAGRGAQDGAARVYHTKAIALLSALVREQPTAPACQHLLALCLLESRHSAERDDETLAQATQILERLVEDHPDAADYRYDLIEAHADARPPRPPARLEETRGIEERLRKALGMSQSLVAEHPHIPQYRASQARIHHRLGSVLRHAKRPNDAEQAFRKAVSLQTEVVRQLEDSASPRLWQATFQNSLADMLARHGSHEEARELLESAIRTLNELVQSDPSMAFTHALLARSYESLAAALRRAGERDLAAEAEQQGREHDQQYRAAFPRPPHGGRRP